MTIDSIPSESFYEFTRNQKTASIVEVLKTADTVPMEGQKETYKISKEKLEKIVNGINEFLQPSHTSLKFELHDELKEYYVQIINERTKEVVR
jgi:flagellar protein FlaG